MRLVVKNVGTDLDPDLLVFAENGEIVEGQISVSIDRPSRDETYATLKFQVGAVSLSPMRTTITGRPEEARELAAKAAAIVRDE